MDALPAVSLLCHRRHESYVAEVTICSSLPVRQQFPLTIARLRLRLAVFGERFAFQVMNSWLRAVHSFAWSFGTAESESGRIDEEDFTS